MSTFRFTKNRLLSLLNYVFSHFRLHVCGGAEADVELERRVDRVRIFLGQLGGLV